MSTLYVDTSAAIKLLVRQAESAALRSYLSASSDRLAGSWLLHTELHCAAARRASGIPESAIAKVLSAVVLIDISRGDLLAAGTHRGLRAHDAIHLATALRIGADRMLTYDRELTDASTAAGLGILSPGA